MVDGDTFTAQSRRMYRSAHSSITALGLPGEKGVYDILHGKYHSACYDYHSCIMMVRPQVPGNQTQILQCLSQDGQSCYLVITEEKATFSLQLGNSGCLVFLQHAECGGAKEDPPLLNRAQLQSFCITSRTIGTISQVHQAA